MNACTLYATEDSRPVTAQTQMHGQDNATWASPRSHGNGLAGMVWGRKEERTNEGITPNGASSFILVTSLFDWLH